jgi:hypothetical protein
MYRNEVEDGQARLSRLGGAEHPEYKQASQVLDESRAMVSNTTDRLDAALKALEQCMAREGESADLTEAEALLGDVKAVLVAQ